MEVNMLTYNYLKISHVLEAYLQGYGISVAMSHFLNVLAACVAIALIAILVNFIAKKIIVRIIKHWVDKSTNQYDDIIYEKGVFNKLSHLAPAVTLLYISPVPLAEYASFLKFVLTGVNIYMLVMVLLVVLSFIDALHEMYGLGT